MADKKSIIKQVRAIRRRLGLTQYQLAVLYNATAPKEITTSRTDISKYESGINTIPVDKYLKLISMTK